MAQNYHSEGTGCPVGRTDMPQGLFPSSLPGYVTPVVQIVPVERSTANTPLSPKIEPNTQIWLSSPVLLMLFGSGH